MSRDTEQDQSKITSEDQLIHYFIEGETPREKRLVGTEHEKFVFRSDRHNYPLIQFSDDRGIESILKELVNKFGWEPHFDDHHLLTLTKNHAAISLEPAGQFELSGKPLKTIHETRDELFQHLEELNEVAGEFAIFASFGSNPFAVGGELPWMPRNRYRIMRNYMAKKGFLGHWMMQTTCTIQANFDYMNEVDAVDILHTAVLISPIINALFANSTIASNTNTGYQSYRAHIWRFTDDDRCGVPDFMYTDDFKFIDYIRWALNVPMYFIRREQGYIAANGLPFSQFLEEGLKTEVDGVEVRYEANMGDFELHLSTLFPEVRLKRYIEVRSADGGHSEQITALPALWKGILYNDTARKAAKGLIKSRYEDHRRMTDTIARLGIHAEDIEGRPLIEIARDLVQISQKGLEEIAKEMNHEPETAFIEPIQSMIYQENPLSLADIFAAKFTAKNGSRSVIQEYDLLNKVR